MLQHAEGDETIRWTGYLLYLNSFLSTLGPAVSFAALFAYTNLKLPVSLPSGLVTVDVTFQVCNVLLLSGMVGPMPVPLEAFQKLAELAGFGLASHRVAFLGHVSENAPNCVVSFPGKYSELWDKAVSRVAEEDAFSLACVFLTDVASGLGRHAPNPETPGECWCQQIYGAIPASAYLSVVDSTGRGQSPETMAFKRADAVAMGQRLLVRQDQADLEWELELADALRDAEARCAQNHGRAPWGCQWFEEWKRNVDRAAERRQVLHVFYFEGSKGKGKLPWELLADARAREDARRNSGLGASQTAEVAYLDWQGLSYVEHDIKEFEDFLSFHT